MPVYIIPIKMVYGPTNGNRTFDPKTHVLSNGKTVINNIIASPIFNPGVNFTQGGTNLGTTQYIDAFQRGNFWKYVHTFTGYHVLLGKPAVLAEQEPLPFQSHWAECSATHSEAGSSAPTTSTLSTRSCSPT